MKNFIVSFLFVELIEHIYFIVQGISLIDGCIIWKIQYFVIIEENINIVCSERHRVYSEITNADSDVIVERNFFWCNCSFNILVNLTKHLFLWSIWYRYIHKNSMYTVSARYDATHYRNNSCCLRYNCCYSNVSTDYHYRTLKRWYWSHSFHRKNRKF